MKESFSYKERWTDAWLDQARFRSDPVADEVIEKIVAEYGTPKAKEIFDFLIRDIGIPYGQLPSFTRSYFTSNHLLPGWTDPEKIRLAEKVFLDHGPKFLVILYYKSLPTIYSCKNAAPVLTQTGRLAPDREGLEKFTRRIAETGQFLLDVMTPGGLSDEGKGVTTILKIRLIHAAIRSFTLSGEWDTKTLGKPINQEDLAMTLMTFSISLIDALPKFGLALTEKESEAFFHAWKVAGYLMGIETALLPDSVEEGRYLHDKILTRQAAPSEDGKLLAQALISFVEKVAPGKVLDPAPQILMRYLIGDKLADMLGIETRKGCLGWLLPRSLSALFSYTERMEDRQEPVAWIMDRVATHLLEKMVDYFDNYKGRHFEIAPDLRQQWGI
ncbi:MAG: oxygenase MpaB family protein [Bacteroidia bacterium]|nr:oxygenase MpaB family protein [Bacteroidia bacterium]